MNKKEIQGEISRRLSAGESKSSVFQLMQGNDLSDRKIAHLIASHVDQRLCSQHQGLIKAMVIIAWVQLAFSLLATLVAGEKMGLIACLLFVAFVGAFAYLFVWGFSNNKAWAYNASILLTIINLPKTLASFKEAPTSSIVALILGTGVLAFTWYVRNKLFPDFLFISAKKVKGSYIFSS